MAVGLIGGAVKTHPIARIAMKILNVKSANEFGEVLAAVGLAQNLGALRALSSEGIQRGHMSLHARNIAVTAGAKNEMVDIVAERMVKERKVRVDRAKEILDELTKKTIIPPPWGFFPTPYRFLQRVPIRIQICWQQIVNIWSKTTEIIFFDLPKRWLFFRRGC